ncbi:MAG: oligosaccharide flippase family protein [Acidobacteria bacterium]|nr:oligosaccharide flippase family protein [Acidobacteriota bacterium]
MTDRATGFDRLATSALAVLGGSSVALLASLAVRVIAARVLGPSDLGLLLLGIAVVTAAGGAASLGLNSATARRGTELIAVGGEAGRGSTGRTALVVASLAGLVAAFAVAGISRLVQPDLGQVLLVLSPITLALPVGAAVVGLSRSQGDVVVRAVLRDGAGGAMRMVAVLLAVVLGGSLAAIAAGFAAGSVAAELLVVAYAIGMGWLAGGDWRRWDRTLLAGLPAFAFLEAFNQAGQWLDTVVLGALAPAAGVGFYGVARGLSRALQMVHQAGAHRFLPDATTALLAQDGAELRRVLRRSRALMFALYWPLAAPCLLAPHETVTLFFGDAFVPAGDLLRVLALGFAAEALFGYADLALVAAGRAAAVARVSMLSTALGLAVMVFAVPRFGVAAAAFAMALASLGRATALAVSLSHGSALKPWTAIGTPAMGRSLLLTLGVAAAFQLGHAAPLAFLAGIVAAAGAGSALVARELVQEHRRRTG